MEGRGEAKALFLRVIPVLLTKYLAKYLLFVFEYWLLSLLPAVAECITDHLYT